LIRRFVILFLLAITTGLLWLANYNYPNIYIGKVFYTFLALTVIYFVFKFIFEQAAIGKIHDSKTRYSFKKTLSTLYIVFLVLVLLRIWVENTQTLMVSYGIIVAGIAVALQDLFKNFMGGIILFVTGIYRVGDRIEIGSKVGDVIDISTLYTTLFELREWIPSDQPTGRLTTVPNGYILSSMVNNYTKDNSFIWDEIEIPITYASDWKKAMSVILDIVKTETNLFSIQAEKEIATLEEKYYLPSRSVEPAIFMKMTDNWITFNIRYIMDVRQRRAYRNKLSQMLLDEINKHDDIKIASTTLDITAFHEIKIHHDKDKLPL